MLLEAILREFRSEREGSLKIHNSLAMYIYVGSAKKWPGLVELLIRKPQKMPCSDQHLMAFCKYEASLVVKMRIIILKKNIIFLK